MTDAEKRAIILLLILIAIGGIVMYGEKITSTPQHRNLESNANPR